MCDLVTSLQPEEAAEVMCKQTRAAGSRLGERERRETGEREEEESQCHPATCCTHSIFMMMMMMVMKGPKPDIEVNIRLINPFIAPNHNYMSIRSTFSL